MQVLIDRDAITGLPTERVFRGHLRTEFQYARRHGQPLSLLLVKVPTAEILGLDPLDAAFEDAIKKLARVLGRDTREYDLVARSGDTEFAIVMRNATAEIGERVANRLKSRIASSDIQPNELPVEFAVSTLTPDMVSSRDMISRAQADFGNQAETPRILSLA
jgi:diguanylate cyclase (GGDEF)-like protein